MRAACTYRGPHQFLFMTHDSRRGDGYPAGSAHAIAVQHMPSVDTVPSPVFCITVFGAPNKSVRHTRPNPYSKRVSFQHGAAAGVGIIH